MSNMPPFLNALDLESHSICLIVEGFEEEVYLNKILQFPVFQRMYKIKIINAQTDIVWFYFRKKQMIRQINMEE